MSAPVGSSNGLTSSKNITTSALVLAVILIILGEFFLGNGGFVEVEPGEVAVVYNHTGLSLFGAPSRVIIDQGVRTFIPGLQSVKILERRPQILVMAASNAKRGRSSVSHLYGERSQRIPPLTVRANDGSNFYFDRLEIFYQVVPSAASKVIATSGETNAFKKNLVAVHAREILRDEFGRYSFLEVANPATYGAATSDAKTRLNERLAPYGIEVTQIITPKPKFEERVERAIEERQNAEQEVEVQQEKRRKLEQEKGLKVQGIVQAKNAEFQALIAELEAQQKAAENRLLSSRREADKYFIEREAAGKAYRGEKVTRAKANVIAYQKEAEALAAKITAVGAQGPDVLNRVIAEKIFPQLKRLKATPLLKPIAPIDIRHLQSPNPQPSRK
ncbi:MAG: hypothetical protein KTR25_19920 [Myxococcales bacterium]|nr:hypothetical protein [Myxococcales bacterium]